MRMNARSNSMPAPAFDSIGVSLKTFFRRLQYDFANYKSVDPAVIYKGMGRGINLANALEAPSEGLWGVTLKEEYFEAIKNSGFSSVRVPICWSAHAPTEAPYTIDPAFFERIDWVVAQAKKNRLQVI